MHDLVHASKCDSIILESSRMCQGVEALQCPLMVMSGLHESGKPPQTQLYLVSHTQLVHLHGFI